MENRLIKAEKIIEELKEALERQTMKLNYKPKYDLKHLNQDPNTAVFGPLQDDESLLLFGILKTTRPSIVLEFGSNNGHSSFNLLKALDNDAKLYSYDIQMFNSKSQNDPRFKFYQKSHSDFIVSDLIDNRKIDFVLIDYSNFETMKIGFNKIINHMSPNGIIAVHNTGLHFNEADKCSCDFDNFCGGLHQIETRLFVNWILENQTEWQTINLHSFKIWRHGLTLFQRKYKLGIKIEKYEKKCKI
jgi:predicted O-methyltransferase YrrM